MTFSDPRFFLALLLLVPVLAVFLVRRQRKALIVPSTMVWRASAKSRSKSRAFRDLRRFVSLALCLGAVASLAFAAARPSGRRSERIVFVVDVSTSMSGTPLEEAKSFVRREVAPLSPASRVAIVTAGRTASVALPFSAPGPRVDEVVAGLRAEPSGAATSDALTLAESLGGSIVVLSDQPFMGSIPPSAKQKVFPRARLDNVGITSLTTRATPDARDDEDREATVVVETSSAKTRKVRLSLQLGAHLLADRVLELAPAAKAVDRVAIRGAGRVVARVTSADGVPDAVPLDDEAALEEAPRIAPRVALVGAESHPSQTFFLEHALRAAGVTTLVRAPPFDAADVAVVFEGATDRPRDKPTFFVGGEPDVGFATSLVAGKEARLRTLASEEPLLRNVSLDEVTLLRSRVATAPPKTARALIDLDGGPAMLRGGAGPRAWVWLGLDLEGSDLVLRVAFPVLVGNVLSTLGGTASVVTAKTAPSAETRLLAEPGNGPGAPPTREPIWKVPAEPAIALATLAAILLAFEAWLSRRRSAA